ncbi:uncharacterized protein TNCV_1871361 [Trichonephila clavipes]|nr:uncharacterized protein TNCV_1871361 [Trichonephila clavipes]
MQHQEGPEFHSEIYLADNMLYKDQTIKITASCDMWMMTKSEVSLSAIVGYNRCHTPRHRIKEALDVSLRYSTTCGFIILPKLIWFRSGWCIPSRCASMDHTFLIGDRLEEQADQGRNSI